MAGWKRLSGVILCTWIASTALTGCAISTKHSPAGPDPLVVALCPELTPLTDDTFGGTTMKLLEVAGIYHECRTAALMGKKPVK